MLREDYDKMLEEQGGSCKLCPYKPVDGIHRALHVDHDHLSGKVRGLLCSGCNRKVIGAVEKIGIEKVAFYLGYKVKKLQRK